MILTQRRISFHVGQLVVCVDNKPRRRDTSDPVLVNLESGRIYTIRGLTHFEPLPPGVYLEEVVNTPNETWAGIVEPSYCADRFRPIKTTSIEALRKVVEDIPRELINETELLEWGGPRPAAH